MDNEITELDKECLEIISDYKRKGRLHPNFLPITTYDMVQNGYPRPNKGTMIARDWGGTDGEGRLLPSDGMWVKVEDIQKLLEKHGLSLNAL